MSELRPCPHPHLCHLAEHRASPASQQRCAANGRRTFAPAWQEGVAWAPRWPDGADLQASELAEALRLAWQRHDDLAGAGGWVGTVEPSWEVDLDRAHPLGGYDSRCVVVKGPFVVTTFVIFAGSHRSDGPAHVVNDLRGRALAATWMVDGERHRTDGPAALHAARAPAFYRHGLRLGPPTGTSPTRLHRAWTDLVAAGPSPADATTWIELSTLVALAPVLRAAARAKDARGARLALERYRAGDLRTTEALLAVASSRAPASWAGSR